MEGRCQLDQVFHDYATVTGVWDTVVLAVTTDAYIEALQQIDDQVMSILKCVVLISPTLGSNNLVRHYLREIQPNIEVISFSTYLGDTRWMDGIPSNQVKTTGVKKNFM